MFGLDREGNGYNEDWIKHTIIGSGKPGIMPFYACSVFTYRRVMNDV